MIFPPSGDVSAQLKSLHGPLNIASHGFRGRLHSETPFKVLTLVTVNTKLSQTSTTSHMDTNISEVNLQRGTQRDTQTEGQRHRH